MTNKKLKQIWKEFTKNNDFVLNPDEDHVNKLVDGVLVNEKKYKLKLCPCRLRDNSKKRDLELLCPCNFKIQENWKNKGKCWCGLFVKK